MATGHIWPEWRVNARPPAPRRSKSSSFFYIAPAECFCSTSFGHGQSIYENVTEPVHWLDDVDALARGGLVEVNKRHQRAAVEMAALAGSVTGIARTTSASGRD
jgi:hypothetical protein